MSPAYKNGGFVPIARLPMSYSEVRPVYVDTEGAAPESTMRLTEPPVQPTNTLKIESATGGVVLMQEDKDRDFHRVPATLS